MRYAVAMMFALFVAGGYLLYERYVVPLTAIQVEALPPPLSGEVEFQPPIFTEMADEYFADAEWTKDAEMKWQRSEQAFLYSKNVEREEGTGNVVSMSPLAILWKDPRNPDGKPYRLIAEKARLQFENEFFDSALDLTDAKPGRIVWSSLEGKVHIDGPDGMVIDGQHFIFSEQSFQLYSDYNVSFAYGPTAQEEMQVVGNATAVNINLTPSDAAVLGSDMPRVSGISSLMLRKNVNLQAKFVSDRKPQTAHISSSGPFEYDLIKQTATFESDVRVQKLESDGVNVLKDEMVCEWLGLEFEKPVTVASSAQPADGMFDDLTFRRLRAVGTPLKFGKGGAKVTIKSQEHGIVANMQDLAYDAKKRIAVMLDDDNVTFSRGSTKFYCPKVVVEHSATNDLQRMECKGAGRLELIDERTGPEPIEALWAQQVNILPEPNSEFHSITLLEDAQFIIPNQMGIGADSIKLWIDMALAQSAEETKDALLKPLPLKRARAQGRVRLVSQELIVKRSNLIDVVIAPGELPANSHGGILQTAGTQSRSRDQQDKPWTVESDEVRIKVLHDVKQGAIDVDEIVGIGNVSIENESPQVQGNDKFKMDGALKLTGVKLIAATNGGRQQTVTILGEINPKGDVLTPAVISMGPTIIGGANLVLDRDANTVTINGAGKFRLPVPEDMSGQPLSEPAILEIVWQERMVFNGLTANFFGYVRCSLLDQRENISRLKCEELVVALNKRISFQDTAQQPQDIQINNITAKHNVELEAYEYSGTSLINVREARLAGFNVNQTTGEFTGQGPGSIDVWSYGDTVRFSPNGTAAANQPASSSSPKWRYTNVVFRGQMVGNVHGNFVELRERVEVVSAPVPQARVRFNTDSMQEQTDQASNAVILTCDRLRATQKESTEEKKKYSELFAYGNTQLEGQKFRAVADELSYDEKMGRFLIRGLGRDAVLYFQNLPGEKPKPSEHRYIEFIPSKPSINAGGSTGFSQ